MITVENEGSIIVVYGREKTNIAYTTIFDDFKPYFYILTSKLNRYIIKSRYAASPHPSSRTLTVN